MVTANLLNTGTDDTVGNCTEMGEPRPSGFDDASHLLIRGNFHWAFEIPAHIMRGERFQLRATFCCEVLTGKIGVSVEMYRYEEKACLCHYAPFSCLPIIHQFLNNTKLKAHIQLFDVMNRRCCEQKRKSDNFHIWENKLNKCLTVC